MVFVQLIDQRFDEVGNGLKIMYGRQEAAYGRQVVFTVRLFGLPIAGGVVRGCS
jgi:hypothetical protein